MAACKAARVEPTLVVLLEDLTCVWVLPAALLCAVSLLRVDWTQEAEDARKRSVASEAERLLQHPSNDLRDVENILEGTPENSSLPGMCLLLLLL